MYPLDQRIERESEVDVLLGSFEILGVLVSENCFVRPENKLAQLISGDGSNF